MRLEKALKEADDQSLLLFNEVKKAWKVAFALQADLKVGNFLCSSFYLLTYWCNIRTNGSLIK